MYGSFLLSHIAITGKIHTRSSLPDRVLPPQNNSIDRQRPIQCLKPYPAHIFALIASFRRLRCNKLLPIIQLCAGALAISICNTSHDVLSIIADTTCTNMRTIHGQTSNRFFSYPRIFSRQNLGFSWPPPNDNATTIKQ